MSNLKKLLGSRIREIRVSRGLTQDQLSELTDIGTSSISKIESGHFHPTDENLEKIANALKIEPYKLYRYNHHLPVNEIRESINNMLDLASEDEIRLVYRVIDGILDKG